MKRMVSFLLSALLLFSLCSCGKYTSSYRAVGLVRSNTSHSCEASFQSLEGRLVFRLKKSDSTPSEGNIHYSIQLDEGKVQLYYDIYGVKELLTELRGGETVDGNGGYIESGKQVYIIIEASDKAKGKVTVELDH